MPRIPIVADEHVDPDPEQPLGSPAQIGLADALSTLHANSPEDALRRLEDPDKPAS